MRQHIPGLLHKVERVVPRSLRQLALSAFPQFIKRLHECALTAAPARVAQAIIVDGPLRGRRFACRLRFEADYIFGTHEPAVTEWLKAYVRPGDTVFDIGAHAGYTTLIAAQLSAPNGCVVAFEPNPANRELISMNLALNEDLASQVIVEASAVSDACGTAFFGGHDTTGSLADRGAPVPTVTLDAYVANGRRCPAVIKMDIEGGETRAFDGMLQVIRDAQPILIVEIHDRHAQQRFAQLVADCHYTARQEGQLNAAPVAADWVERCLYVAMPIQQDRSHAVRSR